ncbi:MAG: hypothetical protein E5Y30_24120 [Mesorhizobium sp.]|nr:MAG: hypothetical protein E5Y30_24120 [Mesorhizobium sp.]
MNEKILATTVSVVVAVVYFTGFCYLYFYYLVFGITPIELDLSVQYVFVHAFPALWYFVRNYYIAILTSFLVLSFAIFLFRKIFFGFLEKSPTITMCIIFIFSIIGSYNAALYSGRNNAKSSLRRLPPLVVAFKSGAGEANMPPGTFEDLRHIITTKNTVFALKFSGNGDDFWVIRIPSESIAVSNEYMD